MRLKKIPFTVEIPEAERKKGYAEYLATGHSAAILTWLVRGCMKWRETGSLGEPEAVKQAVAEYREQQDILHDYLYKMEKKNNLTLTNRYSPGYCNWDVSEQYKLFSFFPKEFCGIKLSDSALMQPIKSVSGIIGAGRQVQKREYRCGICSQKNCIMRNRRQE